MKYAPIDRKLFIENRKRFAKKITNNALAVFNANDIMPTNADGSMGFVQNADLFYLSGIDQEETILLLFPQALNPEHREVLFLKETSEHIAIWEGHKYTKEEATAASGIQTIYWLNQFQSVFKSLMAQAEVVYLNGNEHTRASVEVETRDARFVKWCLEAFPLHTYKRSAPIMHYLRAVKSAYEIDLIKQACTITGKGFNRLLGFVKPGVWEYEIEAELIHEFVRNRSRGWAYGPIIASGFSSNVLHYVENNKQCKAGDVILLDVAAEYANYASDLTRCLPVSGKFTKRQREVYDAVLRVQRKAIKLLKVGNTLEKLNTEVGLLMQEELVGLGLLSLTDIKKQNPKWPAYKKYFMHNTSHFLGLDVHDAGEYKDKQGNWRMLEKNMSLTVEPGCYVRPADNVPEHFWNIGVRIEDDVVVTEFGCEILTKAAPKTVIEIEALMKDD